MAGEAGEFKHRKGNFSPFCHIFATRISKWIELYAADLPWKLYLSYNCLESTEFFAFSSVNINIKFPH